MERRPVIVMMAFAMACSVPWAVAARSRTVWDGVYSDAQAGRGEAVYRRTCALCHGPALDGTENGPELVGAAFFKPYYGKSVADLFNSIRDKMPKDAPGTLSGAETADVLAYMFSVNKFPSGAAELPAAADALADIRIEPKAAP